MAKMWSSKEKTHHCIRHRHHHHHHRQDLSQNALQAKTDTSGHVQGDQGMF